MSSFTSPLVVTPLQDGRNWRLLEEFDYHIGAEDSPVFVHVPAGFETDFASIPRSLEPLLAPWAKYNKAPIVHDLLYRTHRVTRRRADAIFLEAMRIDLRCHKTGRLVARVEWLAVRLFGWLAWHDKRRRYTTCQPNS
jgi:hypothetical protein